MEGGECWNLAESIRESMPLPTRLARKDANVRCSHGDLEFSKYARQFSANP